jgi:hypothetical protein
VTQTLDVMGVERAARLRLVQRRDHFLRRDGKLVLEDPQELVALRIDDAHAGAVLPRAVDEVDAPQKDREPGRRIPGHGAKRLIRLERGVRDEPRPGDRDDRDEVEEREAEVRPGEEVDDPDERDERQPKDETAQAPSDQARRTACIALAPDGVPWCCYRVPIAAVVRGRCLSSIARICSG